MNNQAWQEIEQLYNRPGIDKNVVEQFRQLKSSQDTHTKMESSHRHYCSFFLPYDKEKGMIYLGHHKKADDWIPPGGHIDLGETPSDAAIREMKEELDTTISKAQLEAVALSVKEINRPESGCLAHYDVWHLVHTSVSPFDYLKKEYHDAAWFAIPEGVNKIRKNPDFAKIISDLLLR